MHLTIVLLQSECYWSKVAKFVIAARSVPMYFLSDYCSRASSFAPIKQGLNPEDPPHWANGFTVRQVVLMASLMTYHRFPSWCLQGEGEAKPR